MNQPAQPRLVAFLAYTFAAIVGGGIVVHLILKGLEVLR